MGIGRPTGGFAERMLDSDGWPDVDEDTFFTRAQQYTTVLRQATDVLEAWGRQRAQIFDGGVWTGGAAHAADGKLGGHMDQLSALQHAIATVVTWHSHIGEVVLAAKATISDNLESAHTQINSLLGDANLDADEKTAAIESLIAAAHGANRGVVAATAEQIGTTRAWTPPKQALTDLLDQKIPPPIAAPDASDPTPPSQLPITPRPGETPPVAEGPSTLPGERETGEAPADDTPTTAPTRPETGLPAPAPTPVVVPPSGPGQPSAAPPAAVVVPPTAAPQPATKPRTRPGGAAEETPESPGSPEVSPAGPTAPDTDVPGIGTVLPESPAAATSPTTGPDARNRGVTAASVLSPVPQAVAPMRTDDPSPQAAPAAAGSPVGSSGSGGPRGAAAGPGAGSAAPVAQKPASASAPANPRVSSAPPSKPAPRTAVSDSQPEPPDRTQSVTAAVAVVPVSAARAEREAIASASTADAARRRGPDPLQLARRIAAALNASDIVGDDIGFYWITAVTVAGDLVVANSYGLAYVPDGVLLPQPVQLASADPAIDPAERVRWATYPIAAVHGWAAHHDTTLRAVIATAEQLASTDPGTATVLLEPDDIPDSGVMAGRPRLEVVDAAGARRLAATADERLTDLLPPAPADLDVPAHTDVETPDDADSGDVAAVAQAVAATTDLRGLLDALKSIPVQPNTVADERSSLWFDVMKPMTTSAAGRETAHIRAFHTYATYAADQALRRAHLADDMQARRGATEDWMYWRHLGDLLDSVLGQSGSRQR